MPKATSYVIVDKNLTLFISFYASGHKLIEGDVHLFTDRSSGTVNAMKLEVLRVEALRKEYDDLCVLKDVSFNIFSSEILVVIGSNGAGKSSLSKIISGNESADGGKMYFFDQLVDMEHYSIRKAKDLGIHYISSSHTLVEDYTIAENIFLPYKKNRLYSSKKIEAMALPYMQKVHLNCPPGKLSSNLSTEEQFKVKLASALAGNPKLLILDEPPLLSLQSRTFFEEIINSHTVMLITHNLNDAFFYADRIMLLRDGMIVCVEQKEDLSMDALYNIMSVSAKNKHSIPRIASITENETALEISHLSTTILKNINFRAYPGEIIGLIGFHNSGKTALLDTLYGLTPHYKGIITVNNKTVLLNSPKVARRNGIIYSPWEHLPTSLIPNLRILENLSLFELPRVSINGFLVKNWEYHFSNTYMQYIFNDSINCQTPVNTLSYGTMHKIQLAQCLSTHSKILLLNEPTSGMDLESKEKILETLLEQATENTCILIAASEESSDIINICNRIFVFSNGTIIKEFSQDTFDMTTLLALLQKGEMNA